MKVKECKYIYICFGCIIGERTPEREEARNAG